MKIEPLPLGFGAEVKDFEVQQGRNPQDVADLQAAYSEWNLLIFRNCGLLAPERQVEITGWFGKIGANADEQGRPWTVLHNDNANGSAALPFHSDITFFAHPLEGISLHPQALPNIETSTTFVSNAVAWDASGLPLLSGFFCWPASTAIDRQRGTQPSPERRVRKLHLQDTSFDALVVILSRLRVDGKQRADGAWVACFNFPSFKARIAIRRTCAGVLILP